MIEHLLAVGTCITSLANRASELSTDEFNPSPLLEILAVIVEHNKLLQRVFQLISVIVHV